MLKGTDRVDDSVRADSPRVFVIELDARLDTRSDDERLDFEITFAHFHERHDQRRHNRRNDYVAHVRNVDALVAEQVVN